MLHHAPSRTTRFGVMAAATTGNALGLTATVHAPFGLFLIPLSTEFGWPRASISAVLGMIALAGAVIYPLAGRWADGRGARGILLAGNALLALGIAALSLSNGSLPLFYATFAFIAVVASFGNTAILSKLVSDWFDRDRGTMLGISAGGGNGAGATLVPVLAAALVGSAGWRAGYLGIAALVLLIGFPIMFLGLRDAPRYVAAADHADEAGEAGEGTTGLGLGDAARTPAFRLLLVAIALGAGCTTAVFSHVVPILAERGVSIGMSTTVLAVFAMVTAGWQILMGTLLDRSASPRVVAPFYAMAAAGLALLEFRSGMAVLIAGGVLLGIGLGTQFGALPFLVARYFGLRCFGTVIGALYSAVVLAQGATPILLDHVFDVQGTYRAAVGVICLCLLGGAALLLLLPPYGRRRDAGTAPIAAAVQP